MEFFLRAQARQSASDPPRIGIFPGTFNPLTQAHLALAHAALAHVQEVVFILPKVLPHKNFHGATFQERVEILTEAAAESPSFAVAASEGGLFFDIAREYREAYRPGAELFFLCGRDAAERILAWTYDRDDALESFLREHRLLVAARRGEFEPPERFAAAIRTLTLDRDWSEVSATEIRARIEKDLPWEDLAPARAIEQIRRVYTHLRSVP